MNPWNVSVISPDTFRKEMGIIEEEDHCESCCEKCSSNNICSCEYIWVHEHYMAVKNNDLNKLKVLFEKGKILGYSFKQLDTRLFDALEKENIDMVKYILKFGKEIKYEEFDLKYLKYMLDRLDINLN